MSLYLVIDRERWGHSINVVRAESVEEACKLAGAPLPGTLSNDGRRRPVDVEVTLVEPAGGAAVIWCYDESPDTGE